MTTSGGISPGEAGDIRQRLAATSDFLRKVAIECKAHEDVCAERYKTIAEKFDDTEDRAVARSERIAEKFDDMEEQAKARNAAVNYRLNILVALGAAGIIGAVFGGDKALLMLLKFFHLGI